MTEKARIIAIGLEAADPNLIEKWCQEGHLPTLAALIKQGPYRRLLSTTDISSGSTWASINTGVTPAKHGLGFYHRQLKNGTYQICKKYASDTKRDPFWLQLSNVGKRVAILDIPDTYPTPNLNGVQMVGWGAEGLNYKQSSWPTDFIKNIKSEFGKHPLEGWYQVRPTTVEGWSEFVEKLLEGTRQRSKIAKSVLQKEKWDFFLVGFAEPHWAGHYFWHIMDKNHPEHDPKVAEACSDSILKIYKEIDNSIAHIIEDEKDATILIFSNTGMGPNYSAQHLLPEVLERLGMTSKPAHNPSINNNSHSPRPKKWGSYAIKSVERVIPPHMIEKVKKVIPEKIWDTWTRQFLTLGNHWKNDRAFATPNDFTGLIRINLKGREPHGLVNPGEEYDAICEEISRELLALINPATGKPAVDQVLKVRDTYQGEHIDELPDLCIKWSDDAGIQSLTSPRIGTVSGILPDKRSGAHKTYSFLLAAGSKIPKVGRLKEATIMDIAPTILYLLGEPIPEDMDGEVLLDMMADEFKSNSPIQHA